MTSYQRRRQHWAVDRCRTLAKQGWTDDAISKDTGLPLINVRALTAGIKRHGNQADEKHQAQGRQDGKGEGGDNSTEKVEKPTDRSA